MSPHGSTSSSRTWASSSLKNIARPVRVYRVLPHAAAERRAGRRATDLALPDKPSIAVLAFTNMSNDAEQEFFADGIAEDIITELSRSRSLFVIARNSSFTYKGKPAAIRDVGRELGVRYVLEGSVRNARNRVRVTAQLIEATTGGHVWAERYDRELADIFAVQDEITASVSAAIQPALERSERERVVRKPADSLDAWESYHRGMWHFSKVEATENEKARGFFQRSIELDPQFARAVAALALTYLNEITLFRPHLRAVNLPLALEHAVRRWRSMQRTRPAMPRWRAPSGCRDGMPRAWPRRIIAVSLDPNSAAAHGALGGARLWGGFPREAIEPLQTAMRLSPFDPLMPLWLHFMARARYWSGEYEAAIAVAASCANRSRFPSALQHADRGTRAGRTGRRGARRDGRGLARASAKRFVPSCRCRCTNSANCAPRTASTDRGLPQGQPRVASVCLSGGADDTARDNRGRKPWQTRSQSWAWAPSAAMPAHIWRRPART